VQVIGSTGGVVMSDIAFAPNGALYGSGGLDLYRIDPTTAQTTLIGTTGLPNILNALVFGSDGTLYGASLDDDNLYKINPNTGTATVIGQTGFFSYGDLAFNHGQLYLTSTTDQLIVVNPLNGAGTAIGALGFHQVVALGTDPSTGVLYGAGATTLLSINTATGAATPLFDYSGHGLGLVRGGDFRPAPEPTSLALVSIGGIALLLRRRWHRPGSRAFVSMTIRR
jgi:hypothetical protein